MVKATVKDFRTFLRERRLTRSFNQYNRIKKVKKTVIPVAYSNYDGTSKRSKVYVIRKGNRTIFRDFNTLNVIGSSKLSKKEAIKKLNTLKKVNMKGSFNGKPIDFTMKVPELRLKNKSSFYSYNKSEQRLREVVSTNRIIYGRVGALVTKLELKSSSGSVFRIKMRSRFTLLKKSMIDKLIDENIRAASGKAGFSPFEINIAEMWYEYWLDRKADLTRIK